MNRDRNIQKELEEIGQILKTLPGSNPYRVPHGYFEDFSNHIPSFIHAASDEKNDVAEETEQYAPILTGLSKKQTYVVDNDYFGENANKLTKIAAQTPVKVLDIRSRHQFIKRLALAASFVGLIGMLIFMISKKSSPAEMATYSASIKTEKEINHEIANINTEDIIYYLDQYALPYDRSEIENYLDPNTLPDERSYFDESVLNELL